MADEIRATRADTWRVEVAVENLDANVPPGHYIPLGVWDKKTGGQVDSEEYKFSPGGMVQSISLGGRKTVENVVVSRNYRIGRDHQELAQRLINAVGKARVHVNQWPLDVNGGSYEKPITWKGTLKRFTMPEHDSEASDAAMMEIEITVDGEPKAP